VLAKLKSLDGWKLEGEEIKKKYQFSLFPDGVKFVKQWQNWENGPTIIPIFLSTIEESH
jgi:pterin-4a-carbinolamine dehydratase